MPATVAEPTNVGLAWLPLLVPIPITAGVAKQTELLVDLDIAVASVPALKG